jgi:hypothetical protein
VKFVTAAGLVAMVNAGDFVQQPHRGALLQAGLQLTLNLPR